MFGLRRYPDDCLGAAGAVFYLGRAGGGVSPGSSLGRIDAPAGLSVGDAAGYRLVVTAWSSCARRSVMMRDVRADVVEALAQGAAAAVGGVHRVGRLGWF